MFNPKNIMYVLFFIAILLTALVAFHVVSPDNLAVKDFDKVFSLYQFFLR